MFSNSFVGKSVLVTGHTGFKGSWLCLWLHRLGAKVTGLSLEPPTNPNHFTEANIIDLLDLHIHADVRDEKAVGQAIQQSTPDLILHLAAQTVVRRGYREPLETFSTNVMGTACVLEAIRLARRPCSVVVVTSDKCYDNREQVWGYRESDPMGEKDPYGASKGAAELVVRSYRDSYFPVSKIPQHGIKVASARAGNVIGGGDWTEDALIVDVINALSKNTPALIRNPNAHRPWNHVLQALSGYLTLSAKLMTSDDPAFCSGWNLGPIPGNEIQVREVVKLLLEEWGEGSWIDGSDESAPREAGVLRLCIDKALWELNWKPCWDVRESIRQTAKWYRKRHGAEGNMRDFSLSQIVEYEEAMRLNSKANLDPSGSSTVT
jgi:CDP-glucose 4,6-dehydratase